MKIPSKVPFIAAGVAFLLAAFGLLAALRQVTLVLFALVPLLAGIGIVRRRVWSAYGFALYEVAQLAVIPLALLRHGSMKPSTAAVAIALNLALALLFLLAGKSLAASGARRGLVWPWVVICCLFTLPFLFVQPFVIPSAGMADTLLAGDRVLVWVFPKPKPADGDLIVFRFPPDPKQTYVKRVIGVPGDRIHIAAKVVYRNGVALTEPYAAHKLNFNGDYRDNFPSDPSGVPLAPQSLEMRALRAMLQNHVVNREVVVPDGRYFVLGDNRDHSLDSRYWGFVDAKDIIGKPILIYDSEAQPLSQGPGSGKSVLWPEVRWNRLFKWL